MEVIYKVLKTLNEGQYIAINKLKQNVTVELGQLVIQQEGNVNIPIFHWEIISRLDFSESVTVRDNNPVFVIRQIRKVKKHET